MNSVDLLVNHDMKGGLSGVESLLDEGDPHAHALAGFVYECGGKGVEFDYAKAKYCYGFAVDAVGSIAAALGIARIYFYGKDVERDREYTHFMYLSLLEVVDESIAKVGLARVFLDEAWTEKSGLARAESYLRNRGSLGYMSASCWLLSYEKGKGDLSPPFFLR